MLRAYKPLESNSFCAISQMREVMAECSAPADRKVHRKDSYKKRFAGPRMDRTQQNPSELPQVLRSISSKPTLCVAWRAASKQSRSREPSLIGVILNRHCSPCSCRHITQCIHPNQKTRYRANTDFVRVTPRLRTM